MSKENPTTAERISDHYRRSAKKDKADSDNADEKGKSMSKQESVHSIRHAFSLLVAAEMQRNGGDRQRAIQSVRRSEPGLYEVYVETMPRSGPRLKRR